MEDQKSLSSTNEYAKIKDPEGVSLIPKSKQFDQCFKINRVKQSSLFVSEDARNKVLEELNLGKMFVQIGQYTIMLNTISSIEPLPLRDRTAWKKEEARLKMFEDMRNGFAEN